jgi:hypothetical protein
VFLNLSPSIQSDKTDIDTSRKTVPTEAQKRAITDILNGFRFRLQNEIKDTESNNKTVPTEAQKRAITDILNGFRFRLQNEMKDTDHFPEQARIRKA